MPHRWLSAAVVGLALVSGLRAAPASGPGPGQGPALVVRVQPIERLLAEAKHLTGRVGGAAAVQKLDAAVAEMAGHLGLAGCGLDLRKPLGGYVIARDDLASSYFV